MLLLNFIFWLPNKKIAKKNMNEIKIYPSKI